MRGCVAVVLALATPAAAENVPQWQGGVLPEAETVVVEESVTDRLMALHAISLALTEQESVTWDNPSTGNYGHVNIAPYGNGCVTATNFLFMQGDPVQQEPMTACAGGGNSNTWIINNRWHISSVDRSAQGDCRSRYMDARLDAGRVYSEGAACLYHGIWHIEAIGS